MEYNQKWRPHWIWDSNDLRKDWEFVTVPASGEFVIKHEVPRELIAESEVEKGEKYLVAFTNMCLGTRWWMFGDAEESMKDVRFVQRTGTRKELQENEGSDAKGRWYSGENPDELALVIEGEDSGVVEFEIV
jgi:hypothetical protein